MKSSLLFNAVSAGAIFGITFLCGKFFNGNQTLSSISSNSSAASFARTKKEPRQRTSLSREELANLKSHPRADSPAAVEEMKLTLLLWAKDNPEAALKFTMEDLRPRRERYELITAILQQWARADPETAWDWAFKNLPTESGPLIREVAKSDPAFAWKMASQYASLHEGDEMISRVASRAALSGCLGDGRFRDAIELLNGQDILFDENSSQRVATSILEQWSHYQPEEAIKWVESNAESIGLEHDSALNSAWTSFATSDPEAAIGLASELKETAPFRDPVLSKAIFRMMETGDLTTSEEWVEVYGDDGVDFDLNRVELAAHPRIVREDPARAIQWASRVVEVSARQDAYKRALGEWLVADPSGAEQFLSENEILTERNLYRAHRDANKRIQNLEMQSNYYSNIR